ncbi:outer membrane beta-barrel protein [Pedobacter psychroterrae]|uniref:Outer membrane protein beta-barrel domain-containing protein n=1 Tax=Pedobacter psychroterrae TaxID=2530453 RepID=A0A4R0NCV3_9SPHI|nr:outer membrane beta-barrel protein [Pedobacter psychroterrae]TCC98170.1 hypothetical protein EZ437_18415 [Pedobacter psychroterrae]
MELNDKEFDAAFRKKVFDADPQFEEAAWGKMEQKLKRRDRLVFFRNSAVLCLMLLGAVIGFYSIGDKRVRPVTEVVVGVRSGNVPEGTAPAGSLTENIEVKVDAELKMKKADELTHSAYRKDTIENDAAAMAQSPVNTQESATVPESASAAVLADKPEIPADAKQQNRTKRALPMSLSISAGPEFNSASSLIGGNPGFSAGVAFGVGVTKNLSLQTGVHYSIKDYHTNNYAYKFSNERVQGLISGVEASCLVLEIPLLVSYRISENYKRSIDLNAGISSYFMLREDYTFKYTPQSGIEDRFVERRNENQHYLSVVDLSATYFIKLKKEQLHLGFEPFVKIPLSGVGEGKVNLKSSGISLRLRYDIDKKNN